MAVATLLLSVPSASPLVGLVRLFGLALLLLLLLLLLLFLFDDARREGGAKPVHGDCGLLAATLRLFGRAPCDSLGLCEPRRFFRELGFPLREARRPFFRQAFVGPRATNRRGVDHRNDVGQGGCRHE